MLVHTPNNRRNIAILIPITKTPQINENPKTTTPNKTRSIKTEPTIFIKFLNIRTPFTKI